MLCGLPPSGQQFGKGHDKQKNMCFMYITTFIAKYLCS